MKNIIVYGVGNNCDTLLLNDIWDEINIVAYADKNRAGQIYNGVCIESPNQLHNYLYDELWVTNAKSENIIEYLICELNIPSSRIKDAQYINLYCLNKSVKKNKYIMLTDNVDFLNYPYEILVENGYIEIVYFLFQYKKYDVLKGIDDAEVVFIVRSHILGDMVRSEMLKYLKQHFINSFFTLILSDMVYGKNGYVSRDECWSDFDGIKDYFSLVTTYHKKEAEKLGVIYFPQAYSLKNSSKITIRNDKYVLFVGRAKDRLSILHMIYEKLSEKNVECRFWISGVDEKEINKDFTGITYNTELKYKDYLELVGKCGCLLELTYDGNETSMRYAEAIVFKKRLLINDSDVRNRPFYSKQNVYIFDSKLKFDCNWILDDKTIEYNYDGRFDPVGYLKLLETKL